jgi:hypothetical protein
MNKLFKNTNPHTPEVLYVFEHNGMVIDNPLWNPEMTAHSDPKRYGFEVWDTGGGCTAHAQEFDLDGKKVVMLLTDQDSACIKPDTAVGVAGLYDEDGNEFDKPVYWEVTR